MDHSMHHNGGHHHMTHGFKSDNLETETYRCSMNMLFTWNTENLCLVFRWWHITNTTSLIFSLLGVVALSAGYELLRDLTRRYELRVDTASGVENQVEETSSLLPGSTAGRVPTTRKVRTSKQQRQHVIKGIFYGLQVFYSFFIMLLFMTYNGWVMISVAVGSFIGYLVWGDATATKTVACH